MKTIRFRVFSGTGNSLHLARSLAARLETLGCRTEFVEIGKHDREPAAPAARSAEDIDAFVFPVYALSVPRIVKRYLRALGAQTPLPGGPKPGAAVLTTNGRISAKFRDGHEGAALFGADRLLRRLGWDVVMRETFDYPQSITNLIPPQADDRRTAILSATRPRIESAAEDLASGNRRLRPCRPVFRVLGAAVGWVFSVVGRRFLALLFAADGRCDGCSLCADRCPAGAIAMVHGRPRWTWDCECCERCINRCPRKAIQASIVRIAVMAAVFEVVGALRPFLDSALRPLPGLVPKIVWVPLSVFLGLALFRLADYAILALSCVPGMRPLLAFGWTRWFRRYRGLENSVEDM